MRFSALIPVVCCATALILTFLAMFAGSSPGFMEDYAVVTMNASRIGYNIFNSSQPTNTSDPLLNIFHAITNGIEDFVEDAVNSLAKEFGLHDFYSGHLLTYCEGFYVPGPVPNASVSLSDIHKNTTYCSKKTATFYFNPTEILQNELDQAGHGDIRLQDLQWPPEIEAASRDTRTAARVAFAFYCISIVFIFIAFCLAIAGVFMQGRISASVNLSVSLVVFAAILIASAITTYIAIHFTEMVNAGGQQLGISASAGGKFLAVTWAATALVFISTCVWCVDCIIGRRKQKRSKVYTESKGS